MSVILQQAIRRYVTTTLANYGKVEGPSAVSGGHEGGYKIWKRLTYLLAFPAIALCGANCYLAHQKEHAEHHRPPFVKYEHMYIRTKRFPWGDGNRSFFHNPHTNALPDGYENEH
ncbi:hypothetical protein PPYR_13405 [Photinus pyralis]|uniref:Cytochrome c oxidase polypeptide VIa n=1 Tax=Photinus pyralis TaxID=7054 RepID=A0A5N4A8Y6_PHOPY|nr:cytochrome c oxidase subunit 6A2, mitochondrial-like [Photinus pyralis]KAB0793785.1 hypothetical protein PPYR_13405 [Photinus pyralis]